MTDKVHTGGCLCGAIRYELQPPVRDVAVCHCRQCAKWTGHTVAATSVAIENFRIVSGADELRWYAASEQAQRGFCPKCGSSLFWKPINQPRIAILAGTLDVPTRLKTVAHVYVADKSDYYEITDDLPQFVLGGGDVTNTN